MRKKSVYLRFFAPFSGLAQNGKQGRCAHTCYFCVAGGPAKMLVGELPKPAGLLDTLGLLTKCHIIMGWQNKWEEKRRPMASICVPYQSFEVQGRGGKEAVVLRCLSSPP